jgi:hypothetical protein
LGNMCRNLFNCAHTHTLHSSSTVATGSNKLAEIKLSSNELKLYKKRTFFLLEDMKSRPNIVSNRSMQKESKGENLWELFQRLIKSTTRVKQNLEHKNFKFVLILFTRKRCEMQNERAKICIFKE